MGLESALDFARHLVEVAGQEKKVKTISLSILDSVVVKARFRLDSRFIDVFYNGQTGTTAYSLIRGERRIFGADNTGGWHLHPKNNPDTHRKCNPVSFEDFLKQALKV